MGESKRKQERVEEELEISDWCHREFQIVDRRSVPYSWRNMRRAFDGARINGCVVFWPVMILPYYKGIA